MTFIIRLAKSGKMLTDKWVSETHHWTFLKYDDNILLCEPEDHTWGLAQDEKYLTMLPIRIRKTVGKKVLRLENKDRTQWTLKPVGRMFKIVNIGTEQVITFIGQLNQGSDQPVSDRTTDFILMDEDEKYTDRQIFDITVER